jgi:hypothetical protein
MLADKDDEPPQPMMAGGVAQMAEARKRIAIDDAVAPASIYLLVTTRRTNKPEAEKRQWPTRRST